MTASGMDLAKAQAFAGVMEDYATSVGDRCRGLTGRIRALDWFGPDASRFKSEQLAEIEQRLKQLLDDARRQAADCRSHAEQQERASRE